MGHIEEADQLKEVAKDFGLRVNELRSMPSSNRFVIALDHGTDADRVYVQASPTRITISLDQIEGDSKPLSYEEALETLLDAIGQ
jgi:hypothetical protein